MNMITFSSDKVFSPIYPQWFGIVAQQSWLAHLLPVSSYTARHSHFSSMEIRKLEPLPFRPDELYLSKVKYRGAPSSPISAHRGENP